MIKCEFCGFLAQGNKGLSAHKRLNLECKKKQSAASNISDRDTEETVILEKKRLNLPVCLKIRKFLRSLPKKF